MGLQVGLLPPAEQAPVLALVEQVRQVRGGPLIGQRGNVPDQRPQGLLGGCLLQLVVRLPAVVQLLDAGEAGGRLRPGPGPGPGRADRHGGDAPHHHGHGEHGRQHRADLRQRPVDHRPQEICPACCSRDVLPRRPVARTCDFTVTTMTREPRQNAAQVQPSR
jgi:hypothetical protein